MAGRDPAGIHHDSGFEFQNSVFCINLANSINDKSKAKYEKMGL